MDTLGRIYILITSGRVKGLKFIDIVGRNMFFITSQSEMVITKVLDLCCILFKIKINIICFPQDEKTYKANVVMDRYPNQLYCMKRKKASLKLKKFLR